MPKRKPARTSKKKKPTKNLVIIITLLAIIVLITVFFYSTQNTGIDTLSVLLENSKCKALILDPLSQDLPNPQLIGDIVRILSSTGCTVTVLEGDSFTVNQLESMSYYNLIIFRGHTGWRNDVRVINGREEITTYVALYTGELFSKDKYPELLKQGYVGEGVPLTQIGAQSNKTYVAVTQYYLEKILKKFPENTTVILSTCFSTMTEHLAKVFFEKGVERVIGWSEKVSITHADEALRLLLEKVFVEKKDWGEAVEEVDRELGPDPAYNSTLQILENR